MCTRCVDLLDKTLQICTRSSYMGYEEARLCIVGPAHVCVTASAPPWTPSPPPSGPRFCSGKKMQFTNGKMDLGHFWCTKFWVWDAPHLFQYIAHCSRDCRAPPRTCVCVQVDSIHVLADKINGGLLKLQQAGEDVRLMKVDLAQKEVKLVAAQKETDILLVEITESTAKVRRGRGCCAPVRRSCGGRPPFVSPPPPPPPRPFTHSSPPPPCPLGTNGGSTPQHTRGPSICWDTS